MGWNRIETLLAALDAAVSPGQQGFLGQCPAFAPLPAGCALDGWQQKVYQWAYEQAQTQSAQEISLRRFYEFSLN
jgi:hypothetical protein